MTNSRFEYLFRNSLRSENEKKVIIMLHGYGSNEYDLFSLSENINSNYLIISIRACIEMGGESYCWWPLSIDNQMKLVMDINQAKSSIKSLNNFIMNELANKFKFSSNEIYLLGFSQGCMISYALSINYPKNYKKVIGMSGKISFDIIKLNEDYDYSSHNMIISHGKYDEIIPMKEGKKASDWFLENKIRNKFIETNSAHGISNDDFKILSHWIDEN